MHLHGLIRPETFFSVKTKHKYFLKVTVDIHENKIIDLVMKMTVQFL